jgi:hypothetical protein
MINIIYELQFLKIDNSFPFSLSPPFSLPFLFLFLFLFPFSFLLLPSLLTCLFSLSLSLGGSRWLAHDGAQQVSQRVADLIAYVTRKADPYRKFN